MIWQSVPLGYDIPQMLLYAPVDEIDGWNQSQNCVT